MIIVDGRTDREKLFELWQPLLSSSCGRLADDLLIDGYRHTPSFRVASELPEQALKDGNRL